MGFPIRDDGTQEGEDITLAARNALVNMIELLCERGWTREQAYIICSVAVDLKISNAVDLPNVTVEDFENEFLIRYAARTNARYILRGIRNAPDFHYEKNMRHVNEDLEPDVTTVFLVPPRHLAETSSSFVKGLVGPEGWREVVEAFVPKPVYEAMLEEFG